MQVDESFTAYVAMRWSMLYRLATLLVGDEHADELTRAALVRAYLSWPEVQESASADGSVKRIMARESLELDPGATHSGDDLWAQIAGLLPRQRSMLVLRHYEGLDDGEIADALGCPPSTISSESLALETGIDLPELSRELTRRSDEAVPPYPPLDELVDAGRRARQLRRRRTLTWATGAAAAVVVALALASLLEGAPGPRHAARPAASERFLSMLPTGSPPRIAVSSGRDLQLGSGQHVTLPELPSQLVQTRRWLLVVSLSGEIRRYDPTTGEMHTVASASRGELVTDPSGEHVAWLAAGSAPAVVVVRTVTDWSVPVSDEQAFPARPRCCNNPFHVGGITADGQVVASLPAAGRTWTWRTPDAAAAPPIREVAGLGAGVVSEVTAAGVVVRLPLSQYAVGHIDDGRFVRTDVVPARDAEFADPLGHRVVVADEDGEIHVRDIRSRGRSRRGFQDVRLALPPLPDGFASAAWEDDGHVLLDVSDASAPHGTLVRCAVDTGRCEVAVLFRSAHLVAR